MNTKAALLFALALTPALVNALPGGQAVARPPGPRNITREIEDAKQKARERLDAAVQRQQQQQPERPLSPQEREVQRRLADIVNRTLNDPALRGRINDEHYNKLIQDMGEGRFVPRNVKDVTHDANRFCTVMESFNSSFVVAGSTNGLLSFRVGWANAANAGEMNQGDIKSRCFSRGKRFTYRVAVMNIYESNAPSNRLKLHEFKDKWSGFVKNQTTIDNSSVIIFTNTLVPGGSWGSLRITFRITTSADVAVLDDGSVSQPNRLEWGFKIENWPYASASNSVKVMLGVFSKLARTVDSDSRSVSIGSFGEFSWDGEAKINGVTTAITTSTTSSLGEADGLRVGDADENDLKDETASTIELTFPANAASIDYDPQLNTNEAALSVAAESETTGDQQPTSSAERIKTSHFGVVVSLLVTAFMVNF
jgi:hypothetical protein